MTGSRSCTGPSRRTADDLLMDVVAVLIALFTFAVLVALIFGIERI